MEKTSDSVQVSYLTFIMNLDRVSEYAWELGHYFIYIDNLMHLVDIVNVRLLNI